jgi:hypothetical protein
MALQPPSFQALPSAPQPLGDGQPDQQRPDFKVSAPGSPQPKSAATPTTQPRPVSPEQQTATANAAQDTADVRSQQANSGATDVKAAEAQAQIANYDKATADRAVLEKQQKTEQDLWAKTHAEKQTVVDQIYKQADNYKVDQNKYWHDAGIGDKVEWGIGIALSGLGNAFLGINNPGQGAAPNPVIQMLQTKAHQSVVAQMDQRDQLEKRGARAEHQLDKYDAFSKDKQAVIQARLGEIDHSLAQKVLATAAKFGTAEALANGQTQAALLEQSSAAHKISAAQHATQVQLQQQQIRAASAASAETRRHNLVEESWQKTKFDEEQQLKAAALALKAQGKLSDDESKRAVFAPGPDGKMMPLRNPNGDLVLAGDPAIAQKQKDMIAGATAYNRLVGQMVRAIHDHGGESTWIKGPEWQRQMTRLQSATAELHDAYGIIAFREPTVQFFEKMATSGVDPTSFARDASAALEESNQNLQAKVNEKIGALGYNGPEIKWTDTTSPPPAAETPDDKQLQVIQGGAPDPGAVYDPTTGRFAPKIGGMYHVDPDAPSAIPPAVVQAEAAKGRQYPDVPSGARALLETNAAQLQDPDPSVSGHAAMILDAATRSSIAGVREYAQQLLTNNINAGPSPVESTTTSSGPGRTSGGRSTADPQVQAPPEWILPRN